eukprot:7108636-Prymnesium_polylepis.1
MAVISGRDFMAIRDFLRLPTAVKFDDPECAPRARRPRDLVPQAQPSRRVFNATRLPRLESALPPDPARRPISHRTSAGLAWAVTP